MHEGISSGSTLFAAPQTGGSGKTPSAKEKCALQLPDVEAVVAKIAALLPDFAPLVLDSLVLIPK